MNNEFEEIAYSMVEAYENNLTMQGDIKEVLEEFPHADQSTLEAMWQAIYAYNDIRG